MSLIPMELDVQKASCTCHSAQKCGLCHCILNLYNGCVKEKSKLGILIFIPIACWSIRWCVGPSQGLPHLMMQKEQTAINKHWNIPSISQYIPIYPNIIQYQWCLDFRMNFIFCFSLCRPFEHIGLCLGDHDLISRAMLHLWGHGVSIPWHSELMSQFCQRRCSWSVPTHDLRKA